MENIKNKIICADVLNGLRLISNNMVHLTFTSPPYNILNRSGYYDSCDDNLLYQDYLNWLKEVFSLVYDKTINGGRCVINIDAVTNRQEDKNQEYVRAIYPHLYQIMTSIGWKFRTEICWYKQNTVGKRTAFGSWMSSSNPNVRRVHEYVLCWSKNKWKLDSDISSDLTKEEFEQYTLSTWFIQPETRNRIGHPAIFPAELAKRVIKLMSFPYQIVLDPFVGTGTTCYIAYILNRNYIGIDNSKRYCDYARRRIESGEQERFLYQRLLEEELKNQKTKKQLRQEKEDRLRKDFIFE